MRRFPTMTLSAVYRIPEFRSSWDQLSIMLGLKFDEGVIKNAMTHVLVLSAESEEERVVKRNSYYILL